MVNPDRQAARLAAANARIDARQRGQEAINRMAESMTEVPVEDPAATAASFSMASNAAPNYQNRAAVVDAFKAAMAPAMAPVIRRSGRHRSPSRRAAEAQNTQHRQNTPVDAEAPVAQDPSAPPLPQELPARAADEDQIHQDNGAATVHFLAGDGAFADGNTDIAPADVQDDEVLREVLGMNLLDAETIAVLNARLANSTRAKYNWSLIKFLRWLFDNSHIFPGILNPDLVAALLEANELDRGVRRKDGSPSTKRDHNKATSLAFLNGIDQQNPITFPIDFELLTFNVFAAYLKTFKRTIKRKRARVNPDDNQTVIKTSTITIRLCAGSFNNACSALSHLFTECGVDKSATEVSITMWRKIALYREAKTRPAYI